MKDLYNDDILPQDFEEIAKAYSQSLKKKGFIFINLQEEEFNFLLNEIFVIIQKIFACLEKLKSCLDSQRLKSCLESATNLLSEKFHYKNSQTFEYLADENSAFLCVISLENLLIIKLMLLSVKSEELKLCHEIITRLASVMSESFFCENFVLKNAPI